ncbi:MAG: hypothetical protein AB8V67_01775 [Coxiella endosymbiont of Dermacentor nuttalli]
MTVLFRLRGNFEEEISVIRDKIFSIRDKLPPNTNPSTIMIGTKETPVLGKGLLILKNHPQIFEMM